MTRSQRIRIAVFALFAVTAVIFAGIRYVGIGDRYLGQTYLIAVDLPESGGIFPNAEVTLRGVPIGRVESLELTPGGVRAELRIDDDIEVPADTEVRVAHLSAVGEQYVDLTPQSEDGPFLAAGDVLPASVATTPPRVTSLLVRLDRLATSVGKARLRRVVHELGAAFDDSAQDLSTVLVRARELTSTFVELAPRTDALLRDGGEVLATQRDLDPDLQRLADGLDRLSATLAAADPDLETLLTEAPTTLTEVGELLTRNQPEVAVLLGNLLSVGEILAEPIRLRGLNTQLVLLPRIIQGTFNIQPGDGIARLGAVIDTTQAVCSRGYESSGTPPTQGTALSDEPGNPGYRANLNAFCAEPASSGVGVRGAQHAPRPPGDDTERVVARANPRGFGPGSSFRNTPSDDGSAADPDDPDDTDGSTSSGSSGAMGTVVVPSSTRMVPPTDLAGLLLKEDLR